MTTCPAAAEDAQVKLLLISDFFELLNTVVIF